MVRPDYHGNGLLNLVAEIEYQLTGQAVADRLTHKIPTAATYVLLLFDGLGDDQARNSRLANADVGHLDAPFPTTTTVSLTTIVTGLAPRSHGVIGHQMWIPRLQKVVNTLKWITQFGDPVEFATEQFLASPNLWERLRTTGCEPITVQPADFAGSPLSLMLYRGCRFEPVWSMDELVDATVDLARGRNRFILSYVPHLDFAAHVYGQGSVEHREALETVCQVWEQVEERLPAETVLLGTGDHGHLDYAEQDKIPIRGFDDLTFYGDPRSVFIKGSSDRIGELGVALGAEPESLDTTLLGPGVDHPELSDRLPDAYLAAPPGHVYLPKGFDRRLRGYHGGLEEAEVRVPLLVGNT